MISQSELTVSSHIPAASTGSYPARPGNQVRPLIDGIPTFDRISEAIKSACHSVWLTVAFFAPDFRFSHGRSLFDVLDDAVESGLDARVIFWRPNPESSGFGSTFAGSPADREMLHLRGSRVHIRWDRAGTTYCQHQKCWIIDAGYPTEVAFLGGINLSALAMESPGHHDGGKRHDVYLEIAGPSASDVCHNFVQRWNEASERHAFDGAWCSPPSDVLCFPATLSAPRGSSVVQIQRMVAPGRYTDGYAAPGANRYRICNGERSILTQYIDAIEAAQRTIYIENQALPDHAIALPLKAAVERGIEVVLVVPIESCSDNPSDAQVDWLATLSRYRNMTFATLSVPTKARGHSDIFVHSKLMLVDDEWATIGSCNLHQWSLGGHTELNAAVWDKETVRALRCQLLLEHLAEHVDHLGDREALRRFRTIAIENRERRYRNDIRQQGLATALPSVGPAAVAPAGI